MSQDQDKRGPLWKYVPKNTNFSPRIQRWPQLDAAKAPKREKPREVTEADLEPLRVGEEWLPWVIVKRLGSVEHGKESLPKLLVACGIFQGPMRIRDLTDNLTTEIKIALPKLKLMLSDQTLARRKPMLQELIVKMQLARTDLVSTKARASNDMEEHGVDGLVALDVDMLVAHIQSVVLGAEIAAQRNITGVDFAVRTAYLPPTLADAEGWVERAFGTTSLPGFLLFVPPGYGRVVLVHDDGRLAYDPGPAPPLERL